MTEQQKKANKFLRKKFKGEGHDDLRKLIVVQFAEKVDLIEEYTKMKSWCASNSNKKASLLRFNNWVKRAIQFKEERSTGHSDEAWKKKVEKTKEELKQLEEDAE
jgi:hypothetical protein